MFDFLHSSFYIPVVRYIRLSLAKLTKHHKVRKSLFDYVKINSINRERKVQQQNIHPMFLKLTFLKAVRTDKILPRQTKFTDFCAIIRTIGNTRCISSGKPYQVNWPITPFISPKVLLMRCPSSHSENNNPNVYLALKISVKTVAELCSPNN